MNSINVYKTIILVDCTKQELRKKKFSAEWIEMCIRCAATHPYYYIIYMLIDR